MKGLAEMTKQTLSSVSLMVALVCFFVAFLLSSGWLLHGDHVTQWKDVGFAAIVVALLCGRMP